MATDHTKSIIKNGNLAWNSALNTGNISGLAALYAQDATVSAGDGQIIVGRAAIEQLFNAFKKNGVHNHNLEIIQVEGADKMISQISKWSANGAETNGVKPSLGGITMSTIIQNDYDEWLICAHVWNTEGS